MDTCGNTFCSKPQGVFKTRIMKTDEGGIREIMKGAITPQRFEGEIVTVKVVIGIEEQWMWLFTKEVCVWT